MASAALAIYLYTYLSIYLFIYISIYLFIQVPALLDPEVRVRSSVHIHRDFALDTHIYRCRSKLVAWVDTSDLYIM